MSNKFTPITELLSFIVDNRGKTVPTTESGFPLIATNCIKHTSIFPTFENIRYVDDKTKENWFRAHPIPNDIIFVNKGTPGRVCLVPSPVSFCFAQDMIAFRCDPNKIDYQYLYAVLRSDFIQKKIENYHVGLVIPHFKKGDLKQLEIPRLSSRDEELALGTLYLLLSQKIELNNRINAELEAMAKTLYDYWFVQFDFPDANGKPYKTSGGKMVYNPTLKREIPEGWEVVSLINIASFINGIACQRYFPKEDEKGVLKVIKIREFSSGLDENSDVVIADIPEELIIQDGDVLFSWSATLDVKLWAGGVGALNQHIFKVTSDSYPKTFYYFEVLRYLEHFKMIAALRKTTMGHITKDHLAWSRISLPPRDLIEEMDKKLSPMLEKVISNNQQNMKLTKLRDWLLPMLMNGQVTIK